MYLCISINLRERDKLKDGKMIENLRKWKFSIVSNE